MPHDDFREAERILKGSIWEAGPWEAEARLDAYGDYGEWYPYVLGYKEAADRIINNVIENSDDVLFDTLVYPVMFLYRHYLEIMFKELLGEFRSLRLDTNQHNENDNTNKDPMNAHILKDIWEELRQIIEAVWGEEEDLSFFVDVEHRIDEFHKIDEKSMAFRYPFDKNNSAYFKGEEKILRSNLIQVKDIIDAITIRFSGAIDKLYYEREMLSDYESRTWLSRTWL